MSKSQSSGPFFLGIDAGATRTVVLLAGADGTVRKRLELGGANLRLISATQLIDLFRSIARLTGASMPPAAIGIGMAGVRDAPDEARVSEAAAKVWPDVPCSASHDLETALAAAQRSWNGRVTHVVVLSGTGSCCYGRTPSGKTAKVGGWGHLLGDRGSGYEIGMLALRGVAHHLDHHSAWPPLGERLLRRLQLNEPNDLIGWAQSAEKKEIAALAIEVFDAWSEGDPVAKSVLTATADTLAQDAVAAARRLGAKPGAVRFSFTGSVLLRQPRFASMVARRIRRELPSAQAGPLPLENAWGAVELARRAFERASGSKPHRVEIGETPCPSVAPHPPPSPLSPTERRNPRSMELHRFSIEAIIDLMLDEEQQVPGAIAKARPEIAQAIRWTVHSLRKGGRLFYSGAGTSGRLGVLDASECPPTFGISPDRVQGIIAGGQSALWRAVEGAEDDAEAGARAVEFRNVGRNDILIGIAASGRTPFVWGTIRAAKRRGAKTVLLSFNPLVTFPREEKPDLVIAVDVGPEVLTGSTRLKCGTATKLILNLISTATMIRLGKVRSNLMIDLNPSNVKLRDRAVRIVVELTGADRAAAEKALIKSGWDVKKALSRF